jgi:hypothetical protein
MFYCQSCKKLSKPGEKPHRIVVEYRQKTYTKKIRDKGITREVTVGHGNEIVREANVCQPCVPGGVQ